MPTSARRRLHPVSSTRCARDAPRLQKSTAQFASYLMLFFGHLDAEKAGRSNCTSAPGATLTHGSLGTLGPDTGFDSIGDWPQVNDLGKYLDRLAQETRAAEDDPLQPESRGQLRVSPP